MKHIMFHGWTIMVCIVILVIVAIMATRQKKENFGVQCPRSDASFGAKKFLSGCYANDTQTCRDVLKATGQNIYNQTSIPKQDVDSALEVIMNNTYTNVDPSDSTTYSVNECVISEADAYKLGIDSCRIDDLALKQGNADEEGINWTYPRGCVISEDQVKKDMPKIIKYVSEKQNENKKETVDILTSAVDENRNEKTLSDNNTVSNKSQRTSELNSAAQARNQTTASKNNTVTLTNQQTSHDNTANLNNSYAGAYEPKHNAMKRDCVMAWGEWSSCTKSCGSGTQSRSTYSVQSAENGGRACPAVQTETIWCNTHACGPHEIDVPYNPNSGSIRSVENTGICVDIRQEQHQHNGAPVMNYSCHRPPQGAQLLWRGEHKSLRFRPSTKCMDVAGWGGHGSDIIQWDCHFGKNQQWAYYSDQSLRPYNGENNLCLTRHGEGLKAMTCTGAGNQKWMFA